jgi:hypothetical protein
VNNIFLKCTKNATLFIDKPYIQNFPSSILNKNNQKTTGLEKPTVPNLFFAILPVNPLKLTSLTGVICLAVLGKANLSLIVEADFSVPLVL